jgi:hypothetical protein
MENDSLIFEGIVVVVQPQIHFSAEQKEVGGELMLYLFQRQIEVFRRQLVVPQAKQSNQSDRPRLFPARDAYHR